MLKVFKSTELTLADKVNGAVAKKNFAVSIFTSAMDKLKEANEELSDARVEAQAEIDALTMMAEAIDQNIVINEKLIGNISGLLK